jgi:hypothetical protein
MSTAKDWLEQNHEALYHQANKTTNYLNLPGNLDRMGFSGANLQWYNTEFTPKHTAFNTAFEDWENSAERTPAKTAELKSAEKVFRPIYRLLYGGFLKSNPLVTDTDLVEMGMPERSSGRTPAPVPSSTVEAEVDASSPAVLTIHFKEHGSEKKAKPKGVHGAEAAWEILDTPPTDWSQLTHSVFDTNSPLVLSFNGDQRGKTLYFAMRWENTRGEKGPWSDIMKAIIP